MIARKSLLMFLNTVVGALLGLVALKAIAVYMGNEIYGKVGYALALLGLFYVAHNFGLNGAHTKRMSEGGRDADNMQTYLVARLALILLMLLAAAAFVGFRIVVQGKTFRDTTLITLVVAAIYYAIQSLHNYATTTFNSKLEVARSQAVTFADNTVRTVTTILAAVVYAAAARDRGPLADLLGSRWDWLAPYGPELLALTYLLGAAAALAVALVHLLRHHEFGSFDTGILRSYWAFARPMFVVSIVGVLSTYVDRVTLGYFWSAKDVGIYFGVQRFNTVVQGIGFAVGAVLFPAVSSLASDGEMEEVANVTYRSHRYTTLIVLPMVLFIAVFAEDIIRIFLSNAWLPGAVTMAVLAIQALIFSVYRIYMNVLAGLDRPDLTAKAGVALALVNVTLNVLLVPADIRALGIELAGLRHLGAALALLAGTLVGYGFLRYATARHIPIYPQWPHLLRQSVAGVLAAGGTLLVAAQLPGPIRWYTLLLLSGLTMLLYIPLLWVVREFDRDDLRFFLSVVHPGRIVDYVNRELLGRG